MVTPREAGFVMPAEWEPHAGCWMAWPCRPENWDDIGRARETYVAVARAVARFEPVTMTANAQDARTARAELVGADIDVVVVPSDDSWARDTAPTFLVDGRGVLAGVDWRFNAYGGIYAEYARTANMARRILELAGARRFAAQIVLEGGAVHTDGGGTLLTTVVELPQPARPVFRGRLLSPSYVNFYIADAGIVMPAFGSPADDEARDIVARLFQRREVVQVPTLELAKADGNIHCVTQQQPVA